jgi:hypothetical protein
MLRRGDAGFESGAGGEQSTEVWIPMSNHNSCPMSHHNTVNIEDIYFLCKKVTKKCPVLHV